MKLFVFPHSHYCEKARWALDYKGIPFEPVALIPGFHIMTVRKYAPQTSVPVLLTDTETIQGSSEIIDYLEEKFPSRPLTPSDAAQRKACLEFEHTMDQKLGDNLRRVLYHELLAYPDFICHCFTQPMPRYKQIIVRLFYPILRYKINQNFVNSPKEVEASKRELEVGMGELAQRLANRAYLMGDQFSRADLSVAAMLSLLVLPEEHPFPWREFPGRETQALYDEYENHPVTKWVRKIYRTHRLGPESKKLESPL